MTMPEGKNLFRDYSIVGANSGRVVKLSDFYTSPIDRKRLKELMRRSDAKAFINYGLWLGGVFGFGALLVAVWGSWWAVPVAIIYGVFYGSGGDSRWHECTHGTVFRTRWLNEAFYQLASFMSLRNPVLWRWSHIRHHSETIIVGRDPEIAYPRPPSLFNWVLNLLYIRGLATELWKMLRLSVGVLTPAEASFLPENERGKAYMISRIQILIFACVIGLSLYMGSWLPLMLVGLPSFYGSWMHHLCGTTQHAGLAEDVPDHRLNCRTVYVNPFTAFIYSNMNYHLEHHMFPLVPFYNLPALHAEIKDDCPAPYPSLFAAYREIIPTLIRQQTNPTHFVKRQLPERAGATPDIATIGMALQAAE